MKNGSFVLGCRTPTENKRQQFEMQIVAQSLIFQKEGENHYYFYVNNSLDESFVANDSVASNLNRSCMNAFLQTLCHGENYYLRINFIKVAYTVDIFRLH